MIKEITHQNLKSTNEVLKLILDDLLNQFETNEDRNIITQLSKDIDKVKETMEIVEFFNENGEY